MDHIQTLLDAITEVRSKHVSPGDRADMFDVCGVAHYETVNSKILAAFLRPESPFGFNGWFLLRFIGKFCGGLVMDYAKTRIVTEHAINEGRLDIYLTDGTSSVIIENKIEAADGDSQIRRYDTFAKNKYPGKYKIIYLTKFGDKASEDSLDGLKDDDYTRLSYAKDIMGWLAECADFATGHPATQGVVINYINHIKLFTGQDMDTESDNEIISKMCKTPESIGAVCAMEKNFNNMKLRLLENFLSQMDSICREIDANLEYVAPPKDRNWMVANSGFNIRHHSWKYFQIGFEFDSSKLNNLFVGIHLKEDAKINDTQRKAVFAKLNEHLDKPNNFWAYWCYLSEDYKNWDSDKSLAAIVDGNMRCEFVSRITSLLNLVKDLKLEL